MSNNEETRNQPSNEDTNMTEAPAHQESDNNRNQQQDQQSGSS